MKNNFMRILYITLLVLLPFTMYCQCGNTTLTTQTGVDNFISNGCSTIVGNLFIDSDSSDPITNLNGLINITSISNQLNISGNPLLTSLNGLDNLNSVPNITISINGLTDISALDNLTTASTIFISKNQITSLNGLEGLTTIQSLQVSDNNQLVSLSGLDNLTDVSVSLSINGSGNLTNISALDNLVTVGSISFFQCGSLGNVSGLNNLTTAGSIGFQATGVTEISGLNGLSTITGTSGGLSFLFCGGLTTISGFSSLATIQSMPYGDLRFFDCDELIDVSGLSSLTSVGGTIEIEGNKKLSTLLGLDNIDPTSFTDLKLRSNQILSTCEVQSICEYLDVPSNSATISSNAANCSSRSAVETACAALPVELIFFNAKKPNENIILNWQTASERNNSHFEVERSYNGVDFQTIGEILGNGTTSELKNYQFTDEQPFPGENFYRLKQVDFDGAFEYSYVVSVQIEQNGIAVFPNPTNGVFQIKGTNLEEAEIFVFNQIGQLLKKNKGNESNISDLPTGQYFVKIETEGRIFFERITKL